MGLSSQPRERIATLPTPLQHAPRLSAALGGPQIYIKRDDLTGLALGGNKTRKLEYLVADAKRKGATHLITLGGAQSNHVRQTAAAARLAGMQAILILTAPVPEPEVQGNLLLDVLLGAEYHVVESAAEHDDAIARISDDLRAKGHVPYVIPVGGSNAIGAMGYVSAMLEINYQLWQQAVNPNALYFATGSGGTQAGLVLGGKLYGASYDIRGVLVSGDAETATAKVMGVVEAAADRLGINNPVGPSDIICIEGFYGSGYGAPTPGGLEAIKMLAQAEAILLDTVYTAKAFSGMIADIRSGMYTADDSLIFLHTGGSPALFAKIPDLQPILTSTRH